MKFLIATDAAGDLDVAMLQLDADLAGDLMLHMNEVCELTNCIEIKFNETIPLTLLCGANIIESKNGSKEPIGRPLPPYRIHAVDDSFEVPAGVMQLSGLKAHRIVTKDEVRWNILLPSSSGMGPAGMPPQLQKMLKSIMREAGDNIGVSVNGMGPAGSFSLPGFGEGVNDKANTIGFPKSLLKQLVKGAVTVSDFDLNDETPGPTDDSQ